MELDASLFWLALALTPGLASRLSARLLREFGSPDAIFRARLMELEGCNLPAPVAQAVFKKEAFKRAQKRADGNTQHRQVPAHQLDRARISTDPAANLRPAGIVVRSRRSSSAEPAEHCYCGNPAADALWDADGGASWPRPCGAGTRNCQRDGARNRCHRSSRGDGGEWTRRRSPWHGH